MSVSVLLPYFIFSKFYHGKEETGWATIDNIKISYWKHIYKMHITINGIPDESYDEINLRSLKMNRGIIWVIIGIEC